MVGATDSVVSVASEEEEEEEEEEPAQRSDATLNFSSSVNTKDAKAKEYNILALPPLDRKEATFSWAAS